MHDNATVLKSNKNNQINPNSVSTDKTIFKEKELGNKLFVNNEIDNVTILRSNKNNHINSNSISTDWSSSEVNDLLNKKFC